MKLEEAMYLVLGEAETSAIGDQSENPNSKKVISAVELVQAFFEEHGHHFSDFSIDNEDIQL